MEKKVVGVFNEQIETAFELIKNAEFSKALPILEELEEIVNRADDVQLMKKIAEEKPEKAPTGVSMVDRLLEIYPTVDLKEKKAGNKFVKWLKGGKKDDS